MRSVEGAFHSSAKRRALCVLNHHRRPGDRLKRNPVQADRATKRENHNHATDAVKHVADVIRLLPVRQTTPNNIVYTVEVIANREAATSGRPENS
jgi:hypothetical protein